MRSRSQWMFLARRDGTEMLVGRIIQRITFEMTSGVTDVERRFVRNVWVVVEGVRERRLIVQTGISVDELIGLVNQKNRQR